MPDPLKTTLNLSLKNDLTYLRLLGGNEEFVQRMNEKDPEFFDRLSHKQTPHVMWIGCSDSRVASDTITSSDPGEMFVHRNIANMVVNTDLNMLSALDYAVNVLGVHHVIVCGHYGCGGVQAAMSGTEHGLIDSWLRNIKDVYRLHSDELLNIDSLTSRFRRLVELNVIEQVYNVCKTPTIQRCWKQHGRPFVHGWVYDPASGHLKDLQVSVSGRKDLEEIYRLDVDRHLVPEA